MHACIDRVGTAPVKPYGHLPAVGAGLTGVPNGSQPTGAHAFRVGTLYALQLQLYARLYSGGFAAHLRTPSPQVDRCSTSLRPIETQLQVSLRAHLGLQAMSG